MAIKILVVDDEPQFQRLIQQRFRKRIKEGVYEFLFAENGVEALEVIKNVPDIEVALSDINMPKMDGLTLLGELAEIRALLRTIIVSAYGDMANIRKAMNLGAYDFVTKPIDFTDLEATIQKTLKEVEMLRQAEQAEELAQQNEHLQEIDLLKTRFFIDISHEFRTPLTVITGMAEQIMEDPERWAKKGGEMILRNGANLLELINRILDLRKIESGNIQVHMIQGDILSYLKYLFESFHSLAETRDIDFSFNSEEASLVMDYDPEKILHIVSNLLSNAIKYTPEGGKVNVFIRKVDTDLEVKVKDTGIGISEEQLPYIFERFFQSPDSSHTSSIGTGIGLSLVKELVKLLGGEIRVESQKGEGTTFILSLPITQTAKVVTKEESLLSLQNKSAKTITATIEDTNREAMSGTSGYELPSLLVIEDNVDVAQYLDSILLGHYQLTFADNGQTGIDKALEIIPDLIISDVMLPEKDGFEICQTLKTDQRTSHIPIVLLTARADVASRIEGLEHGADAYLAKPFEKKELFVRLEKLLELRQKLQARYKELNLNEKTTSNPGAPAEDSFILSIQEAIHNNIDDESFGIHELCRMVGLSRTQLHRKIKALTGRSTSLFVRAVRLQKAKELLQQSDLNISQVAYEVGFKDPKYFSRTFTEEFGESPNQFRK